MHRLPIVAHSFLSHGGNKHHKHHNLVVGCITILSHLHITPIPSVLLIMPSVSTNFTRTTHFITLAHYTYSNRITQYTICTPLLYHLYPHYHTHLHPILTLNAYLCTYCHTPSGSQSQWNNF
jgi:hypothetical protein